MGVDVVLKDFRIVTECRLAILNFLDGICRENHLDYFAFGKLLVGAIYYQDFIPDGYDSSVEIGLMREDYAKLVDILKKQVKEKSCSFRIQLLDENENPGFQCIVIRDILIESEEYDIVGNAEVAVCAFDYVPDSDALKKYFYRHLFFTREKYRKLSEGSINPDSTSNKPKAIIKRFANKLKYANGRLPKTYKKVMKQAVCYSHTANVRRLVPEFSHEIPYDQIFPTVRMKLGNMEISAPHNHKYWAFEIDDELIERTKTIQKIDLAITKEFDRVCREIGVGYFICGGTMLGYMRHGGFIPWDDDMDVGMLRADYDRFLTEAPKYLNQEDFFLQTRETDKKIPYLFTKIRMNETEYITNYNEQRDFHKGICLDIFPFDYIPNDEEAQKKFRDEVRRAEKIHNKVVNKQIEKPVYREKAKGFAERRARFINEIRRKITHLVPLTMTQKFYIKQATRLNASAEKLGLTTVASFVPTYTFDTVKDMLPYQDVMFEGVRVMALKDMDKFLTMQYGDYMKLPQMHKRVGHDLIRWSISERMAAKYHIYED